MTQNAQPAAAFSVDDKSYDLAVYFLDEVLGDYREDRRRCLARLIQQTVEDYLNDIAREDLEGADEAT